MNKVTPFLMFDDQLEAALELYTAVFPPRDRYNALFDQAQFRFVFDPVDDQEDPDVPPSWEWPDELASTRNIFSSTTVRRIDLDFVVGAAVDVTEGDERDRTFPEGTKKVVLTDVDLSIEDTSEPGGGQHIIFKVTGDRAHFFLYQDATELQEGLPVWKIFEWRDEKIGARGGSPLFVELRSWGNVKSLYN
jgi:hypothetical protein